MKNFRKVLALVLVVATLFSFAAMATAKEYTDADKIGTNYDTAVEVLSALEILNGYTDGSFKPQGAITRAEMAKMIAVLSNAGDDVSDLYAAACDFADAKDHWAASYIAYCAQTGVVAGYSATAFGPEDNVTGLQTAKMLLVTMGFDADIQGYTGANWKINVLRDAKNFGLLDGFAAGWNADANITREEAAHMMLNALKAPVIIGVVSENLIKVTNALYLSESFLTLKDAEHEGYIVLYGNVVVAGSLTLAEALYESCLKVEYDVDCYGRPGSYWTLISKKGVELLNGKFVPVPMLTSNVDGTIDLEKVLDAEKDAGYVGHYFLNGYPVSEAELEDAIGKGVLVEVYVNDNGYVEDGEWNAFGSYFVVAIETHIGEITGWNKAAGTFEINGVSFKNTFGFTKANIGDVVLFWPCAEADGLHDCKVVTPIEAVVTECELFANDEIVFVAGGKTYEYAETFAEWYGEDVEKFGEGENKTMDINHYIYVDENGYVMYHEPVPTTWGEYSVVTKKGANPVYWVNGEKYSDHWVNMVKFQKDTTAVEVATGTDNTINSQIPVGDTLVWYETNAAGEVLDVVVAETYDADINLNVGKATITGANVVLNDNTQIIVRTCDYATGADKYIYYNGLSEVDVNYAAESMQYFLDSSERYVTYLFLDADYAAESNTALLVSKYSSKLVGTSYGTIGGNKYNAWLNGEEVIVVYEDFFADSYPVAVTSSMVKLGVQIDGMDVWAVVTEADDTGLNYCPTCEILIKGNVVTWQCTGNDHSCGIVEIDGTDVSEAVVTADTQIIIATQNSDGSWKMNKNEDLDDYRNEYGYVQGQAWATVSGGKLVSLVLFVDKAEVGGK